MKKLARCRTCSRVIAGKGGGLADPKYPRKHRQADGSECPGSNLDCEVIDLPDLIRSELVAGGPGTCDDVAQRVAASSTLTRQALHHLRGAQRADYRSGNRRRSHGPLRVWFPV